MRLFDMFEDDIPPLPKKTVAKTWDQMTPQEKISGVKGRTVWNDETRKYRTVFDVPAKSVKEDPNPKRQAAIAIAKKKEQGLKEFALPGGGGGDSGRWYTDDELADIIGDDWFEDFDVSHDGFNIDTRGEKAKQNLVGYANSWFDDKGYNVNVMGVEHNDVDHDLKWYIVGSFQNDNFADKDVDEGAEFGATYAEQLAQKVFNVRPALKNEDDVLNIGYKVAVQDLMSQTRAVSLFSRDQDFPSDYVSAYYYLQKQGVAEAHGNSKIYDKCWTGFRKVPGKTRGEKGSCKEINEFAPAGGDDGDADPYRYPKPEQFKRSVDFFGQFEAGHFDKEDMNDATGEFKGYWNNGGKLKQIAYFKFDNSARTGSNDPGMGWYYEPESDSPGNSTSASPAVDNSEERKKQELSMINAFLKSGQTAKPGSQIYGLMKKHSLAEGKPEVDSLVTDTSNIMQGPEFSDAELAIKTVLGDRAYNERRSYYSFFINQLVDMYGKPEGSKTVDSLVTNALTVMHGPTRADAIAALKTALGNEEYKSRKTFYKLWIDQAVDKYSKKGVAEGSEIKIPTEDGITMQDIRLMAGEGKLSQKTIQQAIAVIRKQRRPQGVAESADEPVHRVGLTVTDPNHPMVSKRGETIQKTVRVTGGDRDSAIKRAIAHHQRKGYKVHDHHYIGTVDEAYNNYHANRTGFAKSKRDLSGEGEPEGMFTVMIDGRPWKQDTSNNAFQLATNVKRKYPNKQVAVKWPNGQLNTIAEDSWHGQGDAWHGTGDAWHGGTQGEA